jgi:cell division septation protein DedD
MPARRTRLTRVLRGLALGVCLWLIAAPPVAALNKNEVRELEDLLARLGFDPGPVDGVLDAQTRTAIKGYQDFAALPVNGQASWSLLDELRSVTESLGDVRIPESAPQTVAGPEAVKSQEKVSEPAFAAPKPPGPKPAAPEKAPVEATPVETAAVPTEAPAPAAASTGPATFEIALQLAAFRSEESARRGWAQIQQQLPGLLGGMNPRFPAADLGEEGTYYRVVTGPFPNRATAADLCAMMTAEGQACSVIQAAPQQMAAATPTTQAAAEPAAPATAPAAPTPAESPPKPAVGEPLAPPPAKPAAPQDEQAAAPLQLAEVETSAPSPEMESQPAKKAGLVPPPAPEPTAEPPEPAPEETAEPAPSEAPEEVADEVAAAPQETATPAPAAETPETASPEVPQLVAAETQAPETQAAETQTPETLTPVTDEAAAEPSAAAPENGLLHLAEAGVFSPFPVEDAPPVGQAPPSAAAEGAIPVPPLDLSEPTPSETPQLASLPEPRAAGLQSADAAFEVNDCQLAIRLYTQALEQGGLSSRGRAEAYNNRGRCHVVGKSFEEAIADFDAAVDLQPNYAAAFFNRGRAHQSLGQIALAQADMQRAYELGFKRLKLSPTTP